MNNMSKPNRLHKQSFDVYFCSWRPLQYCWRILTYSNPPTDVMLMQSDTETQLACLLKLNNVYSTSHLFLVLCNLLTLACDLTLAFSAQGCKFTPSVQCIISRKPDIFLWTDLATNWMLLVLCQICIFLGRWKIGFCCIQIKSYCSIHIFMFHITFQPCAAGNSSM